MRRVSTASSVTVKGKLGQDFPYEVLTGNQESDGHDGDIENIIRCLPNRLPGLQGDYGTQWYVDVPEKDPLVRFVMVSPGIKFQGGQDSLDCRQHACFVPECGQVRV
jgi:hypothetical protein